MNQRSQIERGHEEPFVRQFSIVLPNRVGQLNELLAVLQQAKIEVMGISVVDSADWAVVRVIFSDPDKARQTLLTHGVAFTDAEGLAVVMPEPYSIGEVCKILLGAELNIHFAYPLFVQHEGRPVLCLNVDDPILAAQMLRKHGFQLLDMEE
jgi:hypothetical protein